MPQVSEEAAVAEFERIAEAADVNVDTSTLGEEDADDVAEVRSLFCKAISDGVLSVDEKGQAVMAVKEGEPITFRVPMGADLMIMASANEDKRMEAMYRFVAAITGQSTARLGKLRKREWKLAMRLAGFLSAD